MKDCMEIIAADSNIYKEFSVLVKNFEQFLNSNCFENFVVQSLREEMEEWENVLLATEIILKKIELGLSPTEDIITYNHFAGGFYQDVLSKYLFPDSRKLLSQFMLPTK